MEAIRFETVDGLSLEGELRLPDGAPRGSAVLCHPLPTHGGSKDHPLLWAIRNELAARGAAVLAFNFRGNMGSEGSFEGSVGEVEDVRAAVGTVLAAGSGPTLVAGWSFGANVAVRTAMTDDRINALALVGLPLGEAEGRVTPPLPSRDELRRFDRPVLVVVGEADQFCPLPDARSFARRLPRAEVVVMPGADHFFWKRERELARAVGEFFDRLLAES